MKPSQISFEQLSVGVMLSLRRISILTRVFVIINLVKYFAQFSQKSILIKLSVA